jgi:hypothetical protein
MINSAEEATGGTGRELWCDLGEHHWIDYARGRRPSSCPDHRDNEEARRKAAERRIDNLEMLLRARGTHISQHSEELAA